MFLEPAERKIFSSIAEEPDQRWVACCLSPAPIDPKVGGALANVTQVVDESKLTVGVAL